MAVFAFDIMGRFTWMIHNCSVYYEWE